MPVGESNVLVRLRLLGATRFAGEARRSAASLGVMGRSAEGAAAKMRGVQAAAGTAGAGMLAVGRMIKRAAFPLAALGAVSGKMAMDFQQSMELIHTQAGASQTEVDRLSGSVLNLAKTSAAQSPKQLADALYRLEGAGIRGKNAMKALKASSDLAAVGNANVEDTAKTLSQVWFSGIKGAGNFKQVVAEMNATVGSGDLRLQQLVDALGTGIMPVARNAGLTMKDVTGVLAVFGDETNNVSGWTAQLATALHYLYAPGTKAEAAMQGIGLSGSQLGRDFRKKNGLLTAMTDLRGHLDKLPGGFRGLKAAQVLSKILPGGRGRVLNVLLGQLDRYSAKLKQNARTTKNFGDAVAKTHQTAAFKVHHAWAEIQANLIQLGGVILPFAASAFGGLADAISGLSGAMSSVAHSSIGRKIVDIAKGIGGGGKPPPTPRGPVMPRTVVRGPGGRVEGVHVASRVVERGPGRRVEHVAVPLQAQKTPAVSQATQTGQKIKAALGGLVAWAGKELPKVGKAVMDVGRQILDAFKPAMPFVTNVLLPVLQGITMGVIGGVVVAFKIAVPIIKVLASALGFLGTILKPLRVVFVGIGAIIGFVFGGEIPDALALIGKLGEVGGSLGLVFRLLGGAFKLLTVPIRVANGLIRGGVVVIGRLGGAFLRGFTAVQRFVGTFRGLGGRIGRGALNAVGAVIHVFETLPTRLLGFARSAGSRVISGLASGVRGRISAIASFFGRIGGVIVRAIVGAIKSAPGAILGALTSILPGGKVGRKILHALGLASGGVVRGGGWAVVGERGPELAHLPSGATVYDHQQTRAARRARAPVAARSEHFTAVLQLDGKTVHTAVFKRDRQLAEAT